jgi:hypothetical protein
MRKLTGRAHRAQLDGYLDRIIDRDFPELGHPIRNPAALRRWMTAYAAAVSTTASFETIRDAATGGRAKSRPRPRLSPIAMCLSVSGSSIQFLRGCQVEIVFGASPAPRSTSSPTQHLRRGSSALMQTRFCPEGRSVPRFLVCLITQNCRSVITEKCRTKPQSAASASSVAR